MIIQNNITNPTIDKQWLFKELENYFVQTSDIGRSEEVKLAATAGNQVIDWLKQGVSGVFPGAESTTGEVFKTRTLKETAHDITLKMFNNANAQVNTPQFKQAEKEVYNTAKEWRTFYKEPNIGYKANIESPINDRLKAGTERVGRVYDPPFDIKSAEYKQGVDALVRNIGMNAFDIGTEKKGKMVPMKVDDSKGLYEQLVKEKSDLTMHAVMERESEPRIVITRPNGEHVELKMNIDKMSPATANELEQITGLPQFRDGLYKDIHLEPRQKPYTLDDNKDKTLTNILMNRYGTLEPFKGLKILPYEDESKRKLYQAVSDKWTQIGFNKGLTFEAKASLMDELDDLYRDYIESTVKK